MSQSIKAVVSPYCCVDRLAAVEALKTNVHLLVLWLATLQIIFFSHLIAKGNIKRCSVREQDGVTSRCLSPIVLSVYFSNSWNWSTAPAKNLSKFVSGGSWPYRPNSGCATGNGVETELCWQEPSERNWAYVQTFTIVVCTEFENHWG